MDSSRSGPPRCQTQSDLQFGWPYSKGLARETGGTSFVYPRRLGHSLATTFDTLGVSASLLVAPSFDASHVRALLAVAQFVS